MSPARDPSFSWALLWLGSTTAVAWMSLFLGDSFSSNSAPPRPLTATSIAFSKQAATPNLPAILNPGIDLTPQFIPKPSSDRFEKMPANRGAGNLPAASEFLPPEQEPSAQTTPGGIHASGSLPGSVLLGGPLGLESLHEKAMVPAARTEQALRASAADRLSAVPLHWRNTMQSLVKGPDHVLPAEVVRLPAPHVRAAEEYPMVVKPGGMAETVVNPPQSSKESLERWAERQAAIPPGSLRPVLVVLEPIEKDPSTKIPPSAMMPKAELP